MAKAFGDAVKVQNIELFKCDVATVLRCTKDQPVKLSSQFGKEYRKVFGKNFNPEEYGFQSKSLYSHFGRITDVIRFTRKEGSLAVTLKESNDDGFGVKEDAEFSSVCYPSIYTETKTLPGDCFTHEPSLGSSSLYHPNDALQGIKQFKSDIIIILRDTGNKKVDLSQLPHLYKMKFGNPFCHKDYSGFGKSRLCTFVQKSFMSDIITIEKIRSVIYVKLRDDFDENERTNEEDANKYDTEHQLDAGVDNANAKMMAEQADSHSLKSKDFDNSYKEKICPKVTKGHIPKPSCQLDKDFMSDLITSDIEGHDKSVERNENYGKSLMSPQSMSSPMSQCSATHLHLQPDRNFEYTEWSFMSSNHPLNISKGVSNTNIPFTEAYLNTVEHSQDKITISIDANGTTKKQLDKQRQNHFSVEHENSQLPCSQVAIKEFRSSQFETLSGMESFKSHVREILSEEGDRIEVDKFQKLYKGKFNKNFKRERYGIKKVKKLSSVLKLIPDVVCLEFVGRDLYMQLCDCPTKTPLTIKDRKNDACLSLQNQGVSQGNYAQHSGQQDKELRMQIPEKDCTKSKPKLLGKELFTYEVKEVLHAEGSMEICKFPNAYKRKFNEVFKPEKYKFTKTKQLSKLLGEIPDVVSLELIGNTHVMRLNNACSVQRNGVKCNVAQVSLPPPLEALSMTSLKPWENIAAMNETIPKPSFHEIMLQQKEEKPVPVSIGISKKGEKKTCSKNSEDETLMTLPSPFEYMFNASEKISPLSNAIRSKHKYNTPYKVNELAKNTILEIADDEHYVSLESVKSRMCEEIGVRSLKDLGYRNPDIDIPELKELQRLHSKLDLFGRAYVMVHSIATLSELGQSMARLLDKKDFSDLKVGPLEQLPVVYDLFKAPSNSTVNRSITTMQVLKNLNQYLTKEDKWTSKVQLDKFIQFLCVEYGCHSPYELGVRVQSVGLGISVIKRAQKVQSERSKDVEEELVNDLQREFARRCTKIKDDLLGASHGDERSLIQKLLGSAVIDVLTKVYDHCSLLFDNHHTIKEKDLKCVEKCLESLVSNKPLREFFNLALHLGCKSVVAGLLDECKEEMAQIKEREQDEKKRTAKRPKKGKLTQEIKKWLNSAEDLKISTLAHIEDSVTDPFRPDYPTFVSFGYGAFLEFLHKEPGLNKLIEERGALLGTSDVCLRRSRDMGVLDFIQQCGLKSSKDDVERSVCKFYGVKTLKDLGFGDYDNVVSEIERRQQQHQTNVFYETAILCKDCFAVQKSDITSLITTQNATPKAGILGWKTANEALKALKSAPLLSDLHEWTQWTKVFEPCLGGLKRFIESQATGDIQALETNEKVLLRIDTNATIEWFLKSVVDNDVIGVSGNLISLVVKNGSIKSTPLSLISNNMRPALSKLASADQENNGVSAPQFVLSCLFRMPASMCMALADKVFFEPLALAVGAINCCKLLLSRCSDEVQRSRLHQLGLGLGKNELITDFEFSLNCEKGHRRNQKRMNLTESKPVAVVEPVRMEKLIEDDTREPGDERNEDSEPSSEQEKDHANQEKASDSAGEEGTVKSNPCKVIIDKIREEEFGIGVILSEKEEKLFQKQKEREGRSLSRLSADLYNKDTHFVLELVQNADDNSYPNDVIPALKFVVGSESIMVLNNEVGFSEKNIRALCDVGKSTKGPHQYGYIGQKGIGFKSVFRISDTPEVHSNGYHIRFDAKSGHSGYILPHWIDDGTHAILGENGNDNWMTKIVLPLKDEFHDDKKTSLAARFDEVHPSLLLFLHRLRSITIEKDNHSQKMTRQDLKDSVIEISHCNGTDRWLVVKKQLCASYVREDVEITELAIAFPMQDVKDSDSITGFKTIRPQNVFAYLPIRSYGFKFIIQGDFEVPSSREDVDIDKAWNQWLREEIPKLFIEALEVFKKHPSFSGLSSVTRYFQFVPLEEEVLDFFTPVALAILKYLQGIACLPAEKTNETDKNEKKANPSEREREEYEWMQPCTLVVCDDQKIRTFITPDLLHKHLNLSYLVQEVASSINPALRAKLGVQTLSARHIIDIGRAVLCDSDIKRQYDIKWIAHWLHCIYRCLESEHNSSEDLLSEIGSLDIFPLTDYRLVNLKNNAVFFPLLMSQAAKSKKKNPKAPYLTELEHDLSVLNNDLLAHLGTVGHSHVEKLLTRLGVKSWTPIDVIHNHILPTLKSETWKGKSHSVLQSYLSFIFEHSLKDKSICPMDELRECCQVLTNKGPVNPGKTPVHFTPAYGYELDLRSRIPCISWTLIDDSYLQLVHNVTKQEWQKFFSALDVGHFIAIERKATKLTKMNVDASPWSSHYKNWLETSDGTYIVEDYYSRELEEFMLIADKDANQAKLIAENLDELWKNQYSSYADLVPVRDSQGREILTTVSSFSHYLREAKWLPVFSSPSVFEIPGKLFSNTEQLRRLLDVQVQYADVKLEDESFVKTIGLKTAVSTEDVLKHLISWSTRTVHSATHFSSENISLAHMKRVYEFLNEECHAQNLLKIKDAFQKNSLFFVPKETTKITDRQVCGKFYSMKEVCWNDPSEVSKRLQSSKKYTSKRQILSTHYKDLDDFLRLKLRIDPTPHTDEYIEMAVVLVAESTIPTPAVLEPIFEIFAVLGDKCLVENSRPKYEASDVIGIGNIQIDQSIANYLRKKLQHEAIFPCAERWVTLSDQPIIADNMHLKKIFEKEKNVHFITLECSSMKTKSRPSKNYKSREEKRQSDLKVFVKACGIKYLSEIIEEELTPKSVEYQCHEIQEYFHKVVPSIQRYLYSHDEERYKELKDNGFGKKLTDMKFATVAKLEVVYRLKDYDQVTVGCERKYGFENIGNALHFYAIKQHSKSIDDLNKAITKLFFDSSSVQFENFLTRLKDKVNDGDKILEDFLEDQEVVRLSTDEEEWFIRKPVISSPPEIEISNDFLPPPIQRKARTESDGEMHCWPPRSSVTGAKAGRKNQRNPQKITEMWPQPEAPESTRNDPKSLEGSRLQSYIPGACSSQQSAATEKSNESGDNGNDGHQLDTLSRDTCPPQVFHPAANYAPPSPLIPLTDPVMKTSVDSNSEATVKNVSIEAYAEIIQHSLQRAVPPQMPIPNPSLLPALAPCSPVKQQSSCSTPKSAVGSPSVYSPNIHVTLDDLEFDELSSEIEVGLPLNLSPSDTPDRTEIGRWGEQTVYDYLNRNKPLECLIEWMNEDGNSTSPFDIKILTKSSFTGDYDDVTYIEVKTTWKEGKGYFEISSPELKFALDQRERLHLYRVFKEESTQQVRILRVRDLAKHLENKSVKMFMVV